MVGLIWLDVGWIWLGFGWIRVDLLTIWAGFGMDMAGFQLLLGFLGCIRISLVVAFYTFTIFYPH